MPVLASSVMRVKFAILVSFPFQNFRSRSPGFITSGATISCPYGQLTGSLLTNRFKTDQFEVTSGASFNGGPAGGFARADEEVPNLLWKQARNSCREKPRSGACRGSLRASDAKRETLQ